MWFLLCKTTFSIIHIYIVEYILLHWLSFPLHSPLTQPTSTFLQYNKYGKTGNFVKRFWQNPTTVYKILRLLLVLYNSILYEYINIDVNNFVSDLRVFNRSVNYKVFKSFQRIGLSELFVHKISYKFPDVFTLKSRFFS